MHDNLTVPQALEDASGSKQARVLNMVRLYMEGLFTTLSYSELCHI